MTAEAFPPLSAWITQLWKLPEAPLYVVVACCTGAVLVTVPVPAGAWAGTATGAGAGGLYGFLPSTWQSLGFSGSPQNASVAQQNAAFAKQYARSGSAAWSAYDGC